MKVQIKNNNSSLILVSISLVLLLIFSVVIGVIGFIIGNNIQKTTSVTNADLVNVSATCISEGGHWQAKNKECESISEPKCRELGGIFDACASPCRNNKGDMCIQMCIQVCTFK